MNEKLLISLAEMAREYPGSVETILKIAYFAGRFDAAHQAVPSRYVPPEQPEMVRVR